jgi:hypothetical protein
MNDEGPISMNKALHAFEATEANLAKLERIWADLQKLLPVGVAFGSDPQYEERSEEFKHVLAALPAIDGFRPDAALLTLDEIGQARFDAMEDGEVGSTVTVERWIEEPGRQLRQYRFALDRKRRELVRNAAGEISIDIDHSLSQLAPLIEQATEFNAKVENAHWDVLLAKFQELNLLFGSSVERPKGWSTMARHLHFGLLVDLRDIVSTDWPSIRANLDRSLYGEADPIEVGVQDLGSLVRAQPRGKIASALNWQALEDESFERLIFSLLTSTAGYENAKWLTKTRAPDRGRDLSVTRIHRDALGGAIQYRVIVQCKNWNAASVGVGDVAGLKEQMKLWEPPRVDVLIIVTSGRFSTDAVDLIERNNRSDTALQIEMWPDSHLQSILARRPDLIAEFNLRGDAA